MPLLGSLAPGAVALRCPRRRTGIDAGTGMSLRSSHSWMLRVKSRASEDVLLAAQVARVDAEAVAEAARERVVCEMAEFERVVARVLEAVLTVVKALLALWRAASSSGKAEVREWGVLGGCASTTSHVEVLLALAVSVGLSCCNGSWS
jgi:hypothetical protein